MLSDQHEAGHQPTDYHHQQYRRCYRQEARRKATTGRRFWRADRRQPALLQARRAGAAGAPRLRGRHSASFLQALPDGINRLGCCLLLVIELGKVLNQLARGRLLSIWWQRLGRPGERINLLV